MPKALAVFLLEQKRPELSKNNNSNRIRIKIILEIGGTVGQWRICRYNKRGNALSREKLSPCVGKGKIALCYNWQSYILQQYRLKGGVVAEISKKQFRTLCQYAVHYHFCYCYLCGKPILEGQDWNLDHVFPKSKGGKSTPSNLRPTHSDCNSAKGNMTIQQWREKQR